MSGTGVSFTNAVRLQCSAPNYIAHVAKHPAIECSGVKCSYIKEFLYRLAWLGGMLCHHLVVLVPQQLSLLC